MSSVVSHYETHLAPIYVWMAGGIEHAVNGGLKFEVRHHPTCKVSPKWESTTRT